VAASSRALEQLGEVLIEHTSETSAPRMSAVVALPLESILEPPLERRIRDVRGDAELDTLVDSLREHGLLHPIGVRPLADGHFEVIYGMRRLAAARWLGWPTIQASLHLDLDDEPALVAGLAENLHRRDLRPRERVAALRLLAQIHQPGKQLGGYSTGGHAAIQPPPRQPNSSGDLARKLGVDVSTVSRLAALGRDEQLLGMVETGELGLTSASHVARLPDPLRRQMLEQLEHAHLSSRAVQGRVDQLLRDRPAFPKAYSLSTGTSPKEHSTVVDVESPGQPARLPAGRGLHRLQVVLGLLANMERIETEQEHQVLEQIGEHVARLRNASMAYA
jgi:hypothetical protein